MSETYTRLLGARTGTKIGPRGRLYLIAVVAMCWRWVHASWWHPPSEAIFSDMAGYVFRAQRLLDQGFESGQVELAWQSFGTHYLLALAIAPARWFGWAEFACATWLWASFSALVVPATVYLARACQLPRGWRVACGLVALCWYPHISMAGYFSSEAPFTALQLSACCCLIRGVRRADAGSGGVMAMLLASGGLFALAFAVRPQSLVTIILLVAVWPGLRTGVGTVSWKGLGLWLAPIVLMLVFSLLRYERHTGRSPGIADSVQVNLTAARCHNIVTQAFADLASKRASEGSASTKTGRRVSIPALRDAARLAPDHPFRLRPVLGGESIRIVGELGDPRTHAQLRRRCWAETGVWGQIQRISTNLALLWFISEQWPELSESSGPEIFWLAAEVYRRMFQWVFWLPMLLWLATRGHALLQRRRVKPADLLLAVLLLSSMVIAATVFGSVRLRMPYDPFAWLATASWLRVAHGWWSQRKSVDARLSPGHR